MADAPRVYPGLDVTWPGSLSSEDDPMAELVLAETDAFEPSAAEFLSYGLRVFFRTQDERNAAASHLTRALPDCSIATVEVSDENWAERSQAALRAVQVGALVVAPPWDAPPDRSRTIVIQPSMGFGTGHHASTRLCLRLIQELPIKGMSVLDAGTGSGVLAIAAWKLGARSVVAMDIDSDSIASALECAELNGAAGAIDFREGDLENGAPVSGAPFELILANLTGGMLVRMAGTLAGLLAGGGTLIVSGVMLTEEAGVQEAFQAAGIRVTSRLAEDEWVGLRVDR